MLSRFFTALALLGLVACQSGLQAGGHGHDHGGEHEGADDNGDHGHVHGPEPISRLSFSQQTELFVEIPPFVVGERSRLAAHMTRLKDFKPLTSGHMVVELTHEGKTQRFEVIKPAQPGIFRPAVIPTQAGPHQVTVTVKTEAGQDVHDLGVMQVYPDQEAASSAGGQAQEGVIALLKEQQWTQDFGTAPALLSKVQPSVLVRGTVLANQGQEISLEAPSAGRIIELPQAWKVGQRVQKGQVLARLAPLPGGDTDLPALQGSLKQARLALEHAQQQKERLETLWSKGAIPQARLLEARHHEEVAKARVTEASQRLRQRQSALASRGQAIEIRSPVDGLLLSREATQGQQVQPGATLFQVQDDTALQIEARIPEFDLPSIQRPFGAWVEPSQGARLVLGADQAQGGVGPVDAQTRTAALRFSVEPAQNLHPGASVRVHLHRGAAVSGVVIPSSAVIHEGGQATVFVQRSGEAFERRTVQLGPHDQKHVVVEGGLQEGERVVSQGAWLVKLAASSNKVPDHGHVH